MKVLRTIFLFAAFMFASFLHADTSATAHVGHKVVIEITGIPKAIKGTHYQWYKNGILTKVTSPWMIFNHAVLSDTGTYKAVIFDPRGTWTSDQAAITVIKP